MSYDAEAKVINQYVLRNMLADFGTRSTYSISDNNFIPYFQYKIGAYQQDYHLYFPKEPFALRYKNEIFNKLKEYKGFDIIERRKILLDHFKGVKLDENYLIALYEFYGSINSFIILLFTAIESFTNYYIPNDYMYIVKTEKRTETYDKSQVMYLPFKTKVGQILKEIFKMDFIASYPLKYQHITNLKEMRDNIVHLKPGESTTPYAYIFKKALNFKYEETIIYNA